MFLTQNQIDAVDRRVRAWVTRAPSACLDEAIDLALTAHLSIQALHYIVSDCIEASEGKVPSDLPSAKAIFALSRLWLEPVPGVLKRIAEQEARGEPVARAEMFRASVEDGRFAVSMSPESAAESAEASPAAGTGAASARRSCGMAYSASWESKAGRVIEVLRVVDPVMGQELLEAGDLIAANPFACGAPVSRPFTAGKQYVFRVRDGIVFRLNFYLDPRRNLVVINDVAANGPTPP